MNDFYNMSGRDDDDQGQQLPLLLPRPCGPEERTATPKPFSSTPRSRSQELAAILLNARLRTSEQLNAREGRHLKPERGASTLLPDRRN